MRALGVLLALGSAAVWGAGDFGGGIASRRSHQYQVVALSAASGIVILLGCFLIWREPMPSATSLMWAALAGTSGAFGIAALYHGLSLGTAALVAPTAGVVGAVLPVAFSIIAEGWPSAMQLGGFACAISGIWLVAQSSPATGGSWKALRIAVVAGLGLGGFLILIAQVPRGPVFGPLVAARSVSLCAAVLMLVLRGIPLPRPASNPIALVAGLFDAAGNILYVFARQYTRLDVAAVLSSLYPVSTVVLAAVVLKERVTFAQGVGVILCLTAVALIAS